MMMSWMLVMLGFLFLFFDIEALHVIFGLSQHSSLVFVLFWSLISYCVLASQENREYCVIPCFCFSSDLHVAG